VKYCCVFWLVLFFGMEKYSGGIRALKRRYSDKSFLCLFDTALRFTKNSYKEIIYLFICQWCHSAIEAVILNYVSLISEQTLRTIQRRLLAVKVECVLRNVSILYGYVFI